MISDHGPRPLPLPLPQAAVWARALALASPNGIRTWRLPKRGKERKKTGNGHPMKVHGFACMPPSVDYVASEVGQSQSGFRVRVRVASERRELSGLSAVCQVIPGRENKVWTWLAGENGSLRIQIHVWLLKTKTE